MSDTDITTIRRLPVRAALEKQHRDQVRRYAEQHASPLARRALLALLGRAA